jgi:hypothetical protein
MVLLAAKPIGRELEYQQGETVDVEWFPFIEGASDTVVLKEVRLPAMPKRITQRELLEFFSKSGLSRKEFYLQIIERAEVKATMEVGKA